MHGRPNAASKSGSQLNIIGAAFILCISARRGQPEMSKRQAFPGRRNGWFGDNGVPAKSSRIPDVAIFVPGWNLPPSMPSIDWSVQTGFHRTPKWLVRQQRTGQVFTYPGRRDLCPRLESSALYALYGLVSPGQYGA